VKRNASCARKVIAVFTAAVAVAVFAIPTGIFGNGFQAPPPLPYCCPYPCPYCTIPLLHLRQRLPGAPTPSEPDAPPLSPIRARPRARPRADRRAHAARPDRYSQEHAEKLKKELKKEARAEPRPGNDAQGHLYKLVHGESAAGWAYERYERPPPPAPRAPSRRYASRIDPLTREAPTRLSLSARADARPGACRAG
jgi:hypothetical protein